MSEEPITPDQDDDSTSNGSGRVAKGIAAAGFAGLAGLGAVTGAGLVGTSTGENSDPTPIEQNISSEPTTSNKAESTTAVPVEILATPGSIPTSANPSEVGDALTITRDTTEDAPETSDQEAPDDVDPDVDPIVPPPTGEPDFPEVIRPNDPTTTHGDENFGDENPTTGSVPVDGSSNLNIGTPKSS